MKRRKREKCWWGRDCIHCVIIQSSDVFFFPRLLCCFAMVPQKRLDLSLLALSVKEAADNGALSRRWPGPPNSTVAAVALATGGQKKNQNITACCPAYSHQRPFQSKTLYKSSTRTSLHPIINPLNSDVTTASADLSPLHNNSPHPICTCIDFSDRIYLFLLYGNTLYNLGRRFPLLRCFTSVTLKKAF